MANRALPLTTAIPAACLVLLLLGLLLRAHRDLQTFAWQSVFFLALFNLGGLYGARFSPERSPLQNHAPTPLREKSFTVEPVQAFVTPPYSDSQIGLARVLDENGLIYYKAPSGPQSQELPAGFWIRFFGIERDLEDLVMDPGFRAFLEDQGATAGLDALRPGEIVGVENPFRATFALLLQSSKMALAAGSTPLDLSTRVYQALVLGQRTGLDSRQKEIFRDTGTAHLFAISGLHVGLVATFLFFSLRFLRVSRPTQVLGTLTILLFYVLLTGATPSAVRAFLMITFLVGAKAFRRAYCPASALAASALVVLLIDPNQIFTLGFQLSYTVVLSILVFGAPLAQFLLDSTDPEYWLPGQSGSPFHRCRRWIFASFSISLAAFLGSSVLIIDHFGILPLSSILLNLLLILPATGVLLIGFLSLVAGLLGALWISAPLNWIARGILDAMTWLVSSAAEVPVSAIPVSFHNSWAGPIGMLLLLAATLWTSTRPQFLPRYLILPATSLLVTILIGFIP